MQACGVLRLLWRGVVVSLPFVEAEGSISFTKRGESGGRGEQW